MKNKDAALEEQAKKYFENLPDKIFDFELKKIFAEDDDKFFYFAFEDKKIHRTVAAYFHGETSEFKVRVKIGLTEFCLTEFFTEDFSRFGELISENLESVIKNFSIGEDVNPLVKEKNFDSWEYGKNLPQNLEDFELFISPQNPVPFTNGSHIIINYSDFENSNDLTIYYNVYGDNFSAEARIKSVPHVIYSFDAANLNELESNLEKNLVAELSTIKNAQ